MTYDEAYKAVELCYANARSFLKDFMILHSKKKFDHLSEPLEFALEEIGKAIIITEKLRNSNTNPITLETVKDGLYDHERKLRVVAASRKNAPIAGSRASHCCKSFLVIRKSSARRTRI